MTLPLVRELRSLWQKIRGALTRIEKGTVQCQKKEIQGFGQEKALDNLQETLYVAICQIIKKPRGIRKGKH